MRCRPFSICVLLGLLSCGASCQPPPPTDSSAVRPITLTVSAAASLQDALEAIAPQFHRTHPEIAVAYNFGSSGALQRQIEQGAPADVFFSAATGQMDALAAKGSIVLETRQEMVANRLVLIAPENSTLPVTDLNQLKDAPISRLAVGEFRSVPAGQYAKQALTSLDALPSLHSKLVFGNTVRSVLAAVESGNADLGIVYASDTIRSPRVKVLATIPADTHAPIRYPIAVTTSSPHSAAARQFIAFLQENRAQQTFAHFGFTPLPPDR